MRIMTGAVLIIFAMAGCKTKPATEQKQTGEPQVNAGSCDIVATVVEILPISSTDTADICFKHPCDAIVHVERVNHCGSAATVTPDNEGKIKVHFVNSVNGTTGNSKTGENGPLKIGAVFSAEVATRLAIGDKTNYVIYNYIVM